MSPAATTIDRYSEGSDSIDGVEIFAAGTWRDKSYTPADLKAMADNFTRYSAGAKPMLRVPGVLGHEEQQDLLNRSDLPAAAWAKRLYVENRVGKDGKSRPTLLADFEDVPPEVAKLLRSKAYRTVSAEIYDKPPEGIPANGKMLRRVAFLGGDIPQLKVLNDIPQPRSHNEARSRYGTLPAFISFREERPRQPGADSYWVFSEVSPMDRQALIQALVAKGFDASMLTDAVPDAAIAEMVRVCGSGGSGQGFGDDAPVPPPTDDTMKQQYKERAKKFFDRAKKYADHLGFGGGMKFGDETPADATKKPEDEIEKKFNERLKGVLDRISQAEKFAEERLVSEKKATIESKLTALQKAGKVLPAERTGLARTANGLDAQKVTKFAENGKEVERTQLDDFFATLEARPLLVSYSERMKQGSGKATPEDAETAKIEEHFEVYREKFDNVGLDKKKLLDGFKAYREMHPDTTAEQYLSQ